LTDLISRLNAALHGRYRIERELGMGGMATVYLADDLKHGRKVAVKVLKPDLAAVVGAERFLAEIKLTANLQHPHILPLFDSGEVDSFLFYVMPYVEGETLRDRIDRSRQLAVEEAVGITIDVAEALHAAHEAGVIHRDIKPANILLTKGRPLVADFGIALAVSVAGGGRLTETGLSIGTPFYMSPEQASADRDPTPASDVYSLGCVLYEMLVGEPPHTGTSAQAVLAKVLTENVKAPVQARTSIPAHVDAATRKALERLPADRFASAKDFANALTHPGFRYGEVGHRTGSVTGAWRGAAMALALTSLVLLGTILSNRSSEEPISRPLVFEMGLGEVETVGDSDPRGDVAVSDDGTMFAFAGRGADGTVRLWVRQGDEPNFRPIPGTEGAVQPDFSPDGRELVFRSRGRNALLSVPVAGGEPRRIVEQTGLSPRDPHWSDGVIVFVASDGGLYWVSDTGQGAPQLLSSELGDPHPHLLPGGTAVLGSDGESIYLADFASDSLQLLIPEGRHPTYVPTGHIIYTGATGGLWAVGFDLDRRTVTSDAILVREGVAFGFEESYSISPSGTLVFREGEPNLSARDPNPDRVFLFVDEEGLRDRVPLTPRHAREARITRSGRYIAYATPVGDDAELRVQVYDVVTGSTRTVTSDGIGRAPVWSPDGTRVAYLLYREGMNSPDVAVLPVDGSALPEVVFSTPEVDRPTDWPSEDVMVARSTSGGGGDTWIVPLSGDRGPTEYLASDYAERGLVVSPDGGFAAYESTESGGIRVFMRSFPSPVQRWPISLGRGSEPRWSPDGGTVFYWKRRLGVDSLFAVDIGRPDISPGEPRFVLSGDYADGTWDVHPDGERFLVAQDVSAAVAQGARYLVVLNWFVDLTQLTRGQAPS